MEEETNVAPSAETSAPEPMSFDSALAHLNAQDEAPEQTEPAVAETPEGEEPAAEADQAEAPTEETEANPEADTEADEPYAHGNARTRLRDGTVTTVGELKKAAEQAKELQRQLQERETRDREFEQKQAQIAAQEQQFTQVVQQAKQVLAANFPPKPDYAAYERGEIDIITYNEQQARYAHAVEKWQTLTRAEQAKAQEAQKQQAEAVKHRIARETELLKEAIPELKTEEGFQAFRSELLTHAPKEYGFSAEELANLADHRALRVLKDAIAYRKLQAEKAKVAAKVKDAPPVAKVQAPGRRIEPAERQAQVVKEGLDRLRKSGSFDDALAILNSQ